MLSVKLPGSDAELRFLDPLELFRLCAEDRENSIVWSEFLRRYSGKIKQFIHGTLRQFLAYQFSNSLGASSAIQEDLFQNVIVRLVENDCAAMRRFSGASEKDLLAYLAVICRTSVLDSVKQSNALKRRRPADPDAFIAGVTGSLKPGEKSGFEREILARELISLTQDTINSHSGDLSNRDRLVFELHFFDGLSYSQIAECKGINLSKAGVEKVLKRLLSRVQNLVKTGKPEETFQ